MRVLLAVLSCLALAVLIAVVAVCGVVDLAEAPMEEGLTLAEVAPEFAECPLLSATAVDVKHLTTDTVCQRCPVDLRRQVKVQTRPTTTIYSAIGASERLERPSKRSTCMSYNADTAYFSDPGVRGPGVHPGA